MIRPISDPFAQRERADTGTMRDSAEDLASGVVVSELHAEDTIPAELMELLETPKR